MRNYQRTGVNRADHYSIIIFCTLLTEITTVLGNKLLKMFLVESFCATDNVCQR